MEFNRSNWITLIFTILYLAFFTIISLAGKNYEFLIYLAVMLFFFFLIMIFIKKIFLSDGAIWGLSLWGLLHVGCGNIYLDGIRLYDLKFFNILGMDHLVHLFGFCVATIVAYQLLRPYLKKEADKSLLVFFLVVMMGMGFGALNEVVELFSVLVLKDTGVGDYFNNAFDLVFNMIGAIIAVMIIKFRCKYWKYK